MELELQLETNTHDVACISTLLKMYQVGGRAHDAADCC